MVDGNGRSDARLPVLVAAAVVTVIFCGLGFAARVRMGSVWPDVLTDWTVGSVLLALSSVGVGVVIAARVRRNAVAWLFIAQGVLTAVVFAARHAATLSMAGDQSVSSPMWFAWVFAWAIPLNMTTLSLLVLLFPHGTALGRRWRPVTLFVVAAGVATALTTAFSPYLDDTQTLFAHLPNPTAVLSPDVGATAVGVATNSLLIGQTLAVVGLVVRARRAGATERRQIKWFVYAAVVALTSFFAGFWSPPVFVFATLIALPAVPLAAGIGVLRYRLYDIDRVINRTVVYAAVTGVLAVAYVLAVNTIRTLSAPVAGDGAPAVAASTLLIAALFRPLRARVQDAVDRRFNRARYDAAATAAQLRSRLRDELDLESLKAELLTAVCATMQPAGTTLWLRETKR